MDDEFVTYATAKIMVDNVSYDRAEQLVKEIEDIDGIKEIEFDETQKHYYNSSALFSITFDGQSDDEICQTAARRLRISFRRMIFMFPPNSAIQRRTESPKKYQWLW